MPGLVFLDLDMLEMNGWDLLTRLREDSRTAGIPIVVVSGLARPGVLASPHGVIPMASKPIGVDALLGYAQRLIRRMNSSGRSSSRSV